jgi:minor extracellular protease Epr
MSDRWLNQSKIIQAGDTDGSYYVDDSANKYYRIVNISKYATQVKITDENVIKHYGMINISR